MRKRAIFAAAIAAALMTSCGGAKKSDDEGAAPSNPMLLVSAARAEVHPMTSELRLLGKTVATRHVIIRAPTAGRVTAIKLQSGDSVRKGQVVARVVNREIEAAEAGLEVARKIDPQDATRLSASLARHNRSAGIPVIAPESGIVSQPPVTNGQMVADLDTLVDLIDPKSLYIDTSLPLNELSMVRPGMAATVTTPFRPGVEFPARVAALMPNFDTASQTSSARTDFTGPERIAEASAPVEVRIVTASVPDAIVIPVAALFQDQGADRYHVFIIGADGRAHRTDIKVGLRNRDRVQVTAGVNAGDRVVTSGGYALSDGLAVRVAQGNQ
ncbi:MAG TPA: efflux RND transporter periplasmic adaptor subunit [Candidatus Binatus sp.]|uniref:efflux RND transporter periplasmic adaptor subunit n=1 Tax=Candidatus Binatus sp. TaxID=2811406 RepID=UPI002B48F867|nr:efflux RND transporter periplasmic adaptor subunit [Candidatus Binatus sp.]HKN13220.1 efflux RND transporter periplasmic adaptor subunit [Candidatus Binatus sp.]